MIPLTNHTSELQDRIEFEMPCGWLGWQIGKRIVLPRLRKLFEYRNDATRRDLEQ